MEIAPLDYCLSPQVCQTAKSRDATVPQDSMLALALLVVGNAHSSHPEPTRAIAFITHIHLCARSGKGSTNINTQASTSTRGHGLLLSCGVNTNGSITHAIRAIFMSSNGTLK